MEEKWVRVELYTQLGKSLHDDEEPAMKTSGVKQGNGTARAKALQWDRVGRAWGAERRVARVLGGMGLGCPPGGRALHSRALNQLLQVLDLAAQLVRRREALAHLHEESRDFVAAQEAGRPPPQPMQDAGLHSRCGDTRVSWPCPAHAPRHPARPELPSRSGALESWAPRKSQICDSVIGKSMSASPPSTPSKGSKRA